MRSCGGALLFLLGTAPACLRNTAGDLDALSNGNSNGNGNNPTDASNGGSNGNPTPDAGGNTHPDAGGMGTPDGGGMTAPPCKNKVTSVGSGHHNAGQDCMNSCHFHGFTLAGTLYSSVSGGTALSGASITVKDAAGQTFDIVSQADGNFFTSQSVQFPVTVYASECQIQQGGVPMMATVTSQQSGGCNANGCHTSSAQGRIHLP